MIINGMGTATAQYRIEGQNSGLTGSLNVFTQFTQPSVDSVQEVAVQTSNFAPEFGSVGGGIFNVTMKSGTNQLHGSAYDYATNEVLNAHQPFTHLRDTDRRHDYGVTVGGPISVAENLQRQEQELLLFQLGAVYYPPVRLHRVGNGSDAGLSERRFLGPHPGQRRERRSPPPSGRHRRSTAQLHRSDGRHDSVRHHLRSHEHS